MVCTYGPQVCSVQTPTLGIGSKMSEVACLIAFRLGASPRAKLKKKSDRDSTERCSLDALTKDVKLRSISRRRGWSAQSWFVPRPYSQIICSNFIVIRNI